MNAPQSATQLVDELEASKLPEILKGRVKRQFSGKVFELKDLQAAIKEEISAVKKEYKAKRRSADYSLFTRR